MQDRKVFVDTNILVYAYDKDAGAKHDRAKKILLELWDQDILPVISIQVLQEFSVNLIKKGVAIQEVNSIVEDYLAWEIVENDKQLLNEGFKILERWKCSFWDAMILAAAKKSGAKVLYSEDFSSGQKFGTFLIENPLKK